MRKFRVVLMRSVAFSWELLFIDFLDCKQCFLAAVMEMTNRRFTLFHACNAVGCVFSLTIQCDHLKCGFVSKIALIYAKRHWNSILSLIVGFARSCIHCVPM